MRKRQENANMGQIVKARSAEQSGIRFSDTLKQRGKIYMNINESAENYLETILILSKKLPVVRSVDIATEMNFKKSSISVAMKNLREKGHITVSDAGFITLTESGKKIAEMIYERHTFISNWLINMGIDEKTAVEDACRMEHVISPESFEAIKNYVTKNG